MEEKKVLKLTVTDFISVNHYLGHRAIMKNGKPMSVNYTTKESKKFLSEFAEYVRQQVKEQGWETDLNPFQHYYVDTVFYFPRLDMDTNNYWKVSFDAITNTQLVWADDNLACERVMGVFYDSNNPRIEYTIYKTDFIGIFKDKETLDEFESKCAPCRWYKACSILRKAKEGRVQEEIVDGVCFKYVKKKSKN